MKFVKATVGGVIIEEDRILLALRNHDPFYDHWCFPGGHIDFGESVEEGLQREILEETGLQVVEHHFLNYFTEYYPNLAWHAVSLVFVVHARGQMKRQESEVKQLRWYTVKEALKLPLAFEGPKVLTFMSQQPKWKHLFVKENTTE